MGGIGNQGGVIFVKNAAQPRQEGQGFEVAHVRRNLVQGAAQVVAAGVPLGLGDAGQHGREFGGLLFEAVHQAGAVVVKLLEARDDRGA
jgi:hypothetical protein